MSIVLNNPMQNYMFNISHEHKTTKTPLWRIEALSLRSNDELGAQLLLEHSDDHFNCVILDGPMIDERHLIFHYCDGSF